MTNEEFQEYVIEELKGLRQDVSGIKQDINRIEQKVDNLELKVDGLEQKVDGLEQSVIRIENKLDDMEVKNAERHLDSNKKILLMYNDISFIKHKEFQTEQELFHIKDHLQIIK